MEAQVLRVEDDSHGASTAAAGGGQYRISSAARSWDAQVEQDQNAIGEIDSFSSMGGPFPPGSYQQVAGDICVNSGGASGTMTMEFAEVDSNGNVVNSICEVTADNILANGKFGLGHDPDGGQSCNGELAPGSEMPLYDTMPSSGGQTVYYGFRVWSDDESKPGFPAPSAAARTSTRFRQQDELIAGITTDDVVVGLGGVGGALALAAKEKFL